MKVLNVSGAAYAYTFLREITAVGLPAAICRTLVVVDRLRLGLESGVEFLRELKDAHPSTGGRGADRLRPHRHGREEFPPTR
jgi:hypothetical protein